MTLDEAISVIKSECYVFNSLNLDRSTKINTALDMAIIALEDFQPIQKDLPFIDKYKAESEVSDADSN